MERMRKIYLAQAEISQQNPNVRKGVGLACKTTPFVHPSATIPPVIDVYGEYYRGGSTTGGWEVKGLKGGRKPHKPRAAARPITTIPGLQDIMVLEGQDMEGGRKPRKPRTTQARPIGTKPLTREEIALDNLQKELVRAETQTFNPYYTYDPIVGSYEVLGPHFQIAEEQRKTYDAKKKSRLIAEKKAREHDTYYNEPITEKEFVDYLKKFTSK